MEKLLWAAGVQLEPIHHNLLPVMMGSGKRHCVSCKTLGAKEAGMHGPKHICRGCGSLERPHLQPQAEARGRSAGGWDGDKHSAMGWEMEGSQKTVGSQKKQETISHPKV